MGNWDKAFKEATEICAMPLKEGIEYIEEKYKAKADSDGVYEIDLHGIPTSFFAAFEDSKTLYFEN